MNPRLPSTMAGWRSDWMYVPRLVFLDLPPLADGKPCPVSIRDSGFAQCRFDRMIENRQAFINKIVFDDHDLAR
jgi:hypothetical protein